MITPPHVLQYAGEWRSGQRCGVGKYAFANGNVYDGDWANNLSHGVGSFVFVNGDVYVGDWRLVMRVCV
jgi:hypothetical protein